MITSTIQPKVQTLGSRPQNVNNHAGTNNQNNAENGTMRRGTKCTTAQKVAIAATSALGIGSTFLAIAKCQKPNEKLINIAKNIFKTPPKIAEKEVFALFSAATATGLVAGKIFDSKANFTTKIKEANCQFIGNGVAPLVLISGVNKIVDKIQDRKDLKEIFEKSKTLSNVSRIVPTVIALGSGIVIGNKIANKVNDLLFEKQDHRPLKVSDITGHVDDCCTAAAIVASKTGAKKIEQFASRVIPLALSVPSYLIGTARDK